MSLEHASQIVIVSFFALLYGIGLFGVGYTIGWLYTEFLRGRFKWRKES